MADVLMENENFLVFGDEWGAHPNSTEHLLRRLGRGNRFLWVHLLGLRGPEWSLYDLRRAFNKFSEWFVPRPRQPGQNGVAAYSPVVLPFSRSQAARWWNRRMVLSGVRRRLAQLHLQNPIFFASAPNAAEVVGGFEEKLVVYFCEDEHAELPGVYRNYVQEMEEKLLERADLVLVTSKALLPGKSRPKAPALLLPHGVDFGHFHSSASNSTSLPGDLAFIPRPRLGFVGLLSPWVDVELVASVARAHPWASVVLIGPVRTDVSCLKGEKNVFLLGARPYAELPRYLSAFDLGLIPFRQIPLTRYINPLKLLEYLAAGLPVVSTALPDLETWGDLVYCAQRQKDFVELVGEALRNPSVEQRERRINVARENSWERRAAQLSRYLEEALRAKTIPKAAIQVEGDCFEAETLA